MQGTIKAVRTDRGFGFIKVPGQDRDAFFHYRDLDPSLEFGEQLVQLDVEFELVDSGGKGPKARHVRKADE